MRSKAGISCFIGVAVAQTGANCDVPCENYELELKTANNLYSQNVYNIGGIFATPASTVEAVCNISGNDIQTCFVCSKDGQGLSGDTSQLALLDAWRQTCATFQKQGVNNAYACWLSIPSGSGQCAYSASRSGTQQSTTLSTTPLPSTVSSAGNLPTSVSSASMSTSVSSTSVSPTSVSSTGVSQTSSTPSTSPSANSAVTQHVAWHGSFVGAVLAGLVDMLW